MVSVWVIIQFVNTINCISIPCKVDGFSIVSIKLAAHQPRMESMLACGSVRKLHI